MSRPLVILIRKNSLSFYFNNLEKKLDLPTDVIQHLEIKDSNKYQKLVTDFMISNEISKQKTYFLLSPEVTFQKTVPIAQIKDLNQTFEDFLSLVPVESDQLARKYLQFDDKVIFLATNKSIFQVLENLLMEANWTISAVIPLGIVTEAVDINDEVIKQALSNKNLIKGGDLLTDSQLINNSPETEKPGRGWLVTIVLLLVLIGLIGGGYFTANKFFNKPNQTAKKSLATIPPPATSSATPTITESKIASPSADKLNLTVQVLNGSGIAGQANKIKDQLATLGFSQINTGNAVNTKKETIISFSKSVPTSIKKEIIDLLNQTVATVSAQESTSNVDILITTGQLKSY